MPIKIELANGITIQGRIDVEDAKRIFREPNGVEPIDGGALGRELVVVLPASKVKKVQFPFWPGPSELNRHGFSPRDQPARLLPAKRN